MKVLFRSICMIFGIFICMPGHSMTVSGAIQASTVTVTGPVTMSDLVISSLTVANQLNITGATAGIQGSVVQMVFTSTTTFFHTTSFNFDPDPSMAASITLKDPADYVRVTLSGMAENDDSFGGIVQQVCYVTIMRSSGSYTVDLGDPSINQTGLAAFRHSLPSAYAQPVGIVLADFPLQATTYTYQVYLRAELSSTLVGFVNTSLAYLTLEEIHP